MHKIKNKVKIQTVLDRAVFLPLSLQRTLPFRRFLYYIMITWEGSWISATGDSKQKEETSGKDSRHGHAAETGGRVTFICITLPAVHFGDLLAIGEGDRLGHGIADVHRPRVDPTGSGDVLVATIVWNTRYNYVPRRLVCMQKQTIPKRQKATQHFSARFVFTVMWSPQITLLQTALKVTVSSYP